MATVITSLAPRCHVLARRACLCLARCALQCLAVLLLRCCHLRVGHGQVPTVPLSHDIFTHARCLLCCTHGQADAVALVAPVLMQPAATPSSSRVHARPLTAAASLLLLAATEPRWVTVASVVPVPLAAKAEPSS